MSNTKKKRAHTRKCVPHTCSVCVMARARRFSPARFVERVADVHYIFIEFDLVLFFVRRVLMNKFPCYSYILREVLSPPPPSPLMAVNLPSDQNPDGHRKVQKYAVSAVQKPLQRHVYCGWIPAHAGQHSRKRTSRRVSQGRPALHHQTRRSGTAMLLCCGLNTGTPGSKGGTRSTWDG